MESMHRCNRVSRAFHELRFGFWKACSPFPKQWGSPNRKEARWCRMSQPTMLFSIRSSKYVLVANINKSDNNTRDEGFDDAQTILMRRLRRP